MNNAGIQLEQSPQLLRGLDAIASFLQVNRKTASAFVRDGLPVTRIGLPVVSTPRLVFQWVESRCLKGNNHG